MGCEMRKEKIYKDFKGKKICVIGDIIYDRFIFGNVSRVSPEAPVPVVEVWDEKGALGGAANVANNIKALGGEPILLGVIGKDTFGKDFLESLKKQKIESKYILLEKEMQTIVKTRLIAQRQQIARIDREKKKALPEEVTKKLKRSVYEILDKCDAVIASDYAKGTFNQKFLLWLGEKISERKIPYIVDPKPQNFPYPKATIVTPNRSEAAGFLHKEITKDNIFSFAGEILSKTDWKAVLITLGEDGMALYERNSKSISLIPAKLKEVYDVTGAGDTVVSAMAMALSSGYSYKISAEIANAAASVVVTKLGTATCSIEELIKSL